MLDLEASEPTVFWTYARVSEHEDWGYGDDLWIANRLDRPTIRDAWISFDAPEEWGYGIVTLKFRLQSEGRWDWTDGDKMYDAVRTDTTFHTILTGTWRDSGYRGVFIAVLPNANQSLGV